MVDTGRVQSGESFADARRLDRADVLDDKLADRSETMSGVFIDRPCLMASLATYRQQRLRRKVAGEQIDLFAAVGFGSHGELIDAVAYLARKLKEPAGLHCRLRDRSFLLTSRHCLRADCTPVSPVARRY